MWPFSRHYSFEDIAFLKGATDFHSHILPGVDDGIRTRNDALEVLSWYEGAGVRDVWLTPHIMEDFPNEPAALRKEFAALQASYSGPLVLHLGAENMMDTLFEQRFFDGDLLKMGEEGTHLLLETSYFNPPMRLYEILDEVRSRGIFPILAHPERYVYMSRKDYGRLKEMGILFQLNLMSLTGIYGPDAATKSRRLLLEGKYDFYGSDLHRLSPFRRALSQKVLSKKEADALLSLKERAKDFKQE